MANQQAKIDDDSRASLIAVTDDSNAEIRRLVVDPVTNRLKVSAVIAGAPGNLAILNHGVLVTNTPTTLDFEGSAVVVTNVGDNVTLTFTPSMVIGEVVTGGTPTNILFIDSLGNLGQDANFTYNIGTSQFNVTIGGSTINSDGTTGTTTISSYGIAQMQVSDSTGIQQFGDIGGDFSSDLIKIDGVTQQISLQHAGQNYLLIDNINHRYSFGDIDSVLHGTALTIDDNLQQAGLWSLSGGYPGFFADFASRDFSMGDTNGSFNYTSLNVDDLHNKIEATNGTGVNGLSLDYAGHGYKIGDFNNTFGGTYLFVNDNAGVIAGLGLFGTVNGFNLNFPGHYYTLGEFSGSTATYIQTHNDGSSSSILMNGNLHNAGTQNTGAFFDFFNSIFTIGDVGKVFNQTYAKINDALSTFEVSGFKKTINYTTVPSQVTGLADLTWDDTYIGTANVTYNVWIDSVGISDTFAWQDSLSGSGAGIPITAGIPFTLSYGQTITWASASGHDLGSAPINSVIKYTTETVPFVPGDIIDNGAGVTATVIGDDGLGNLTIQSITGGVFAIGNTVTGSYSGAVTTIDSVQSYFQENITFTTGRMLALDGQGLITTIGDVDGFAQSVVVSVDNVKNEVHSTANQTFMNGQTLAYKDISGGAGYNIKVEDYTVVSSSSQTINIPSASTIKGRVYVIKNASTTPAVTLTIKTQAGENLDGASSTSLLYGKSLMIQSDGTTGWKIIAVF